MLLQEGFLGRGSGAPFCTYWSCPPPIAFRTVGGSGWVWGCAVFYMGSLFLLPTTTLASDLVGKPERKGQVGEALVLWEPSTKVGVLHQGCSAWREAFKGAPSAEREGWRERRSCGAPVPCGEVSSGEPLTHLVCFLCSPGVMVHGLQWVGRVVMRTGLERGGLGDP